MIEYLFYHSRCTLQDFHITDLDILRTAISVNEQHGLTGFLHREAGYFIQYFEGPKAKIEQLTANLVSDRRHSNFTVIGQGEMPHRLFQDWSMGYSNSPTTVLGLVDKGDAVFTYNEAEVAAFLQSVAAVNPQPK